MNNTIAPSHPGEVASLPQDGRNRVRLGASADTGADVLLELARDADVTVRAAVAMNPAVPGHVDQMLACDSDERVRVLLARKLANLLPALLPHERDRLGSQALSTIEALVEDEAVRVRAALADVLKDMPQAPRALVLRLAHDHAATVCEPVIRLSPLLTAEDLLGLLRTPGSEATATAIARRPHLPPLLCDAVAETADTLAIAALLENGSAAIQESTLDALIACAAEHETWHRPLVRRPQLSSRAAQALSDIVATQLLDELASRADLEASVTDELRRRLAARLRPTERARAEPNLDAAMVLAHRMFDEERLNEPALLATVQRGEARMATAMLAVAAEVPVSVVDRAATLRSAKGLVSLVWKAGFSMAVAGPLQILLARLAPNAVLRGAGGEDFPLSLDEMRWQIEFLMRMGR